ncbi:hypothetical protein EAI_01882 [Harpegnathos saltator]|uniref:Uncharacterized protein n=1 Tax=Harpegnathos saltator TaxID=610380 RepID=E2BNE6_HARSA|nr:hypothetical protein EAI_01882 [Harpegnathos saltator]
MGTEIHFRKWNQDVLVPVLEEEEAAAAAAARVQARLLGTVSGERSNATASRSIASHRRGGAELRGSIGGQCDIAIWLIRNNR